MFMYQQRTDKVENILILNIGRKANCWFSSTCSSNIKCCLLINASVIMIISYVIMACSVTGSFPTSIKKKKKKKKEKKKKKLASWLTPQCEPPAVRNCNNPHHELFSSQCSCNDDTVRWSQVSVTSNKYRIIISHTERCSDDVFLQLTLKLASLPSLGGIIELHFGLSQKIICSFWSIQVLLIQIISTDEPRCDVWSLK